QSSRWASASIGRGHEVLSVGGRDRAQRSGRATVLRRTQSCRTSAGGNVVKLEDARHASQVVSAIDLFETDRRERAGAKNQLHYLLRSARATELSTALLERE